MLNMDVAVDVYRRIKSTFTLLTIMLLCKTKIKGL